MPKDTTTRPLVLVAEPDVESAVAIERQLLWAGYGVVTTGAADEVREVVVERRPEALVIEAMLPEMSGYELVRELRAQPQNRLMPIAMVSARAGKLDRDFAFTVGADDYLKKPFRCADLVARVTQLVPPSPAPVQPPVRRSARRLTRVPQLVPEPVLAGR